MGVELFLCPSVNRTHTFQTMLHNLSNSINLTYESLHKAGKNTIYEIDVTMNLIIILMTRAMMIAAKMTRKIIKVL